MKVTAYHRTNAEFETFNSGSFFCATNTMPDSYGDTVITVELEINNPAKDADVLSAAIDLGLESETVEKPYEYLSPGLMDACVGWSDVEAIIELLIQRGFDGALVNDCDCPLSWVIFSPNQVTILERK